MLSLEYKRTFWLPGRGVGKARPRTNFETGAIYTAGNYRDWKDFAIEVIKIQMTSHLLPAPQPCRVECEYINFKSSDVDNLLGSVLDALHQADYLGGDSAKYVCDCQGKFAKVRKERNQPKLQGILVKIFPAQIPIIEIPADIDFAFWGDISYTYRLR